MVITNRAQHIFLLFEMTAPRKDQYPDVFHSMVHLQYKNTKDNLLPNSVPYYDTRHSSSHGEYFGNMIAHHYSKTQKPIMGHHEGFLERIRDELVSRYGNNTVAWHNFYRDLENSLLRKGWNIDDSSDIISYLHKERPSVSFSPAAQKIGNILINFWRGKSDCSYSELNVLCEDIRRMIIMTVGNDVNTLRSFGAELGRYLSIAGWDREFITDTMARINPTRGSR